MKIRILLVSLSVVFAGQAFADHHSEYSEKKYSEKRKHAHSISKEERKGIMKACRKELDLDGLEKKEMRKVVQKCVKTKVAELKKAMK